MTHASLEGHGPVPVSTHRPGPAAPTLTMVGPRLVAGPKASKVLPQMACLCAKSSLARPPSTPSPQQDALKTGPPIPTWPLSLYAPQYPRPEPWLGERLRFWRLSAFSHLCLPAPGLSYVPNHTHPGPRLSFPFPQAGD